ncbi:MAG: carboxylating nicotinate-nucleotide diphosphorylase [Vampirovibrionales bacterium]
MIPAAYTGTQTPLPPGLLPLIDAALAEDLSWGDCTVDALGGLPTWGTATLSPRQPIVVSGALVAQAIFQRIDPSITVELTTPDGSSLQPNDPLLVVQGPIGSLLKAERTALNMLQHLCGIATHTQAFVAAVAHTPCHVVDTRKTTPGLRALEKAAVRHGGGHNHRLHLGDAAMLKDNHWASMGITLHEAMTRLRRHLSHTQTITVECDTLEQVQAALALPSDLRPDSLLLDNMDLITLRTAVDHIHRLPPHEKRPLAEASGGVTLNTVGAIAQTGVDLISTSQLTLGAPPVDIGMELHQCVLSHSTVL